MIEGLAPKGTPLSFLVAPDSFKGTFRGSEVARALAMGLADAGASCDPCPVADGGEGTGASLLAALGGRECRVAAHDPLGRPIEAEFFLLTGGRTAVVETASASGLALLGPEERNAETSSTRGTGELISAAIEAGAQTVIVAAGGSATSDGGLGAIELLRERGGVGTAQIEVLCDVNTKFEDAARVFGPQKGADPATVERLTMRLMRIAKELPRDPRGVAMTGCAGGLSGGLWATFDANLRSGADYVLESVDFEPRLNAVDAVIAGEGQLDAESFNGKIIGQIARLCARYRKDLHVVVGRNALDRFPVEDVPIRSVREAGTLGALQIAGREIATRPK